MQLGISSSSASMQIQHQRRDDFLKSTSSAQTRNSGVGLSFAGRISDRYRRLDEIKSSFTALPGHVANATRADQLSIKELIKKQYADPYREQRFIEKGHEDYLPMRVKNNMQQQQQISSQKLISKIRFPIRKSQHSATDIPSSPIGGVPQTGHILPVQNHLISLPKNSSTALPPISDVTQPYTKSQQNSLVKLLGRLQSKPQQLLTNSPSTRYSNVNLHGSISSPTSSMTLSTSRKTMRSKKTNTTQVEQNVNNLDQIQELLNSETYPIIVQQSSSNGFLKHSRSGKPLPTYFHKN